MRFMTLWRPGKKSNSDTPKMQAEMQQFIQDLTKSGQLVQTGGWDPNGPRTVVTNSNGELNVTDGPFAEAKEMIAGYAIIDVKSKEEIIELTKRFLRIAGEGSSEVRQIGP